MRLFIKSSYKLQRLFANITMSKTKKSGANHYEILLIIPNKFTDEESKIIYEGVEKTLVDFGGEITHREYWGKKRLAYEIKHNAFGYYGLYEFDLDGAELAKVDSSLRLSTNILRHQVVVKQKKTALEIAQAESIRAKIDSKKASADKKAEEKQLENKKSHETKTKEPEVTQVDHRAKLKDLDEKLEDIINAEDLI